MQVFAFVLEDLGPLPEVVQQQCGKHDDEPTKRDGPPSEVSHVGVECLTSGDDKEQRTHREKPFPWVGLKVADCPDWVDGLEDFRGANDALCAEHGKHGKPHEHDGPEHFANPTGTPPLH